MILYAQTPARRAGQVVADVGTLAWTVGWVVAARWLHGQLLRLSAPGRSVQHAGRGLADALDSAGRRVGGIPFAGDALRKPFQAAGRAGRTLEQAGAAQQEVVVHLALWVPLLIAAPPILYVAFRWASGRLRWMRRVSAVSSESVDLDLLALRALSRQPVRRLRRLGPDPAGAWRRGDEETVRALAGLELADLGLRPGLPEQRVTR